MGANADLVRSMYDAYARDDAQAAFTLIDPEIDVDYRGPVADAAGSYRGYAGMAKLLAAVLDSFGVESLRVALERIEERGDRVAVGVRQSGTETSTGALVEMRLGQVWTLRDGKAVRWEVYRDWDEALAAL